MRKGKGRRGEEGTYLLVGYDVCGGATAAAVRAWDLTAVRATITPGTISLRPMEELSIRYKTSNSSLELRHASSSLTFHYLPGFFPI